MVALLAMRQQGLRCEQPFALGTALVEVHSRRPLLRSSHHRLATSRTELTICFADEFGRYEYTRQKDSVTERYSASTGYFWKKSGQEKYQAWLPEWSKGVDSKVEDLGD